MNDAYVFIPALGLASCVGLILGFIYFDWYERHQRAWQIRLQETVQAAIVETLARPKPIKVVKPHRLYTPPKPASPCDCPRCRLAQIRQNATPAPSSSDPTPMTAERDAELSALQSDLIPAYLWPFLRDETVAMIGFLPDIQMRLRLHGFSGKIQTALGRVSAPHCCSALP